MKLEEMADVLDGLALTLEKHLGKTAVSDLHALGNCLRKFSGESVAAFCNFTVQAREGKATGSRAAGKVSDGEVQELVARIRQFLDHRRELDYAVIRHIVTDASKLKVADIKAIGERLDYHLTGRNKAALVSSLENWLSDVKASAEQTGFTLAGAGT